MKHDVIETIVGLAIIIIAIGFFAYAYKLSNQQSDNQGYVLSAKFQNAEGIVEGSDVMIAGIKVGSVKQMILEKNTYSALIKIVLNQDVKIPEDSTAAVTTSGFLGSKFISITPGGSETDLKENEQIKYTQSSVNIEALIGKFIYSTGNK